MMVWKFTHVVDTSILHFLNYQIISHPFLSVYSPPGMVLILTESLRRSRHDYYHTHFTDEESRVWVCYDLAKITQENIGLAKNFFAFSHNIL